MLIIFRTLAFIMTIIIVVPLYLLKCIMDGIFGAFNNLTFHNFVSYEIPLEMLQKYNLDYSFKFYLALKIWMLISMPIINIFIEFWNGVKSVRF